MDIQSSGSIIKIVAFVELCLGIVASLIYCVICLANELVGAGLLVLIGGGLGSCLTALFLYGFGQLVYNSDLMVYLQQKNNVKMTKLVKTNTKKGEAVRSPLAVDDIIVDGMDVADYYLRAKRETDGLTEKKRDIIVQNHRDWAKNVTSSTIKDLCETLDESDDWDEDFVRLTCLEIIFRVESKNN